MFAPESYWRDLVAFTWNIKTIEGRDEIRDMLRALPRRSEAAQLGVAEGEIVDRGRRRHRGLDSRSRPRSARGYGLMRLKAEGASGRC